MLKVVTLVLLSIFSADALQAQLRRFYSLQNPNSYDSVDFTLKATSGISFFRHVNGGNPLNIFGNPDLDRINPSFEIDVVNRTCQVNLNLSEFRKSVVGDGLVYAMMSSKEEDEENYWKFLLNDQKVYNLNLNYGIGSSDIDLSGTHVSGLQITTGSADVTVNYRGGETNLSEMDTFMIKVDLGSIIAHDLERSRARNLIAEIGFGQAVLDFRNPVEKSCNVKATVGAGKLEVLLPINSPVIIHMKESPLCNITMAEGYEEMEKGVYVNMLYAADALNLLTFDIEVSMGVISFANAED